MNILGIIAAKTGISKDGKPIGTHWCLFAFLHKLGTVVYVDPYGSPPPEEVVKSVDECCLGILEWLWNIF